MDLQKWKNLLIEYERNTENPNENIEKDVVKRNKMRALIRTASEGLLQNADAMFVLNNRNNISKVEKSKLWEKTTLSGTYRKSRPKGKQTGFRHVR